MSALRICIAVATCCVAFSAAADDATSWRALYRDGSRQYDLGDFRAALDSFKRAYLAHEEAGILFDIAECHRQLGENPDAVRAYQSYLRRKPDAANRADVEALIGKLQDAPATTTPPAPPPVAPTPAPEAAHGSVYNPWGATASAPPPSAAQPATPVATPVVTPAPAPPAWAPTGVEAAPPPRAKSRAWIAAIVVPAVAVLAVSIGVSAWYLSPAPTYSKVGPAQ